MTPPLRVLYVCTANICRSAYADVRSRSLVSADDVAFASAGVWGFDRAPLEELMAAQAVERGADPSGFRSQRLSPDLVAASDLILTMARDHRAFILDDWPGAVTKTFTLSQFADGLAALPDAAAGVHAIEAVRARRNPPRRDGDVADPYRQGVPAAAACAAEIDRLLGVILPRLAGPHLRPE